MKCCICGKKESVFLLHRGKFCFVCDDCYHKLPTCVKESLPSLSAKDVTVLTGLFKPTLPGMETPWRVAGQVGISDTHVHIEGFQVEFRYLQEAKLEFLQREGCRPEAGGFWSTYGDICMVFTISGYQIRTLVRSARVFLSIRDAYPDFLITRVDQVCLAEDLRILCGLMNAGAKLVTHNLSGYRGATFGGKSRWTDGQTRSRGASGAGTSGAGASGTGASGREQKKQEQSKAQRQREPVLETALAYYGLSLPFTAETLKKKRNALIRKCHPDQVLRDDTLNPGDVNRFYDVLQRYAEKDDVKC